MHRIRLVLIHLLLLLLRTDGFVVPTQSKFVSQLPESHPDHNYLADDSMRSSNAEDTPRPSLGRTNEERIAESDGSPSLLPRITMRAALSNAASKVAQTSSQVKAATSEALSSTSSQLAETGGYIASTTQQGAQAVASVTGAALSSTSSNLSQTGSSIASTTQQGAQSVVNATGRGVQAVASVTGAALSSTSSQLSQTTGFLASTTQQGAQSMVNATGRGAQAVASVTSAAISSTSSQLSQAGDYIASTTQQGAQSVANATSRGAQAVASVTGTALSQGGANLRSASQRISVLAHRGTEGASSVAHWVQNGATTANTKAKAFVLQFTGQPDYHFGDITKEVLRRAAASDYNTKDMLLVLKVLLTLGVSFTPLAKIMPLTLLLELLNESLEARVGGKVLEVLAGSVDARLLAAFDAEEMGDFAKRSLSTAVVLFTGKKEYQKGDIAKAAVASEERQPETTTTTLDVVVGTTLEDWDRAFRESQKMTVDGAIEQSLDSSLFSEEEARTLDATLVEGTNKQGTARQSL